MSAPRTIHQRPEILILRDDQTMLIQRPLEDRHVTHVGINITREKDVITGDCQHQRNPAPDVVIYQEA